MNRPKGSPNASHAEERARLVAAVRESLPGMDGAFTFRNVAARAGVSVGALQHYFGTRDGLVLAIFEDAAGRAAPYLGQPGEADTATAAQVIRAYLETTAWLWTRGVGELHLLGIVEGSREGQLGASYLTLLLEPSLQTLEGQLARLQARGLFDVADVRLAALEIIAPVFLACLHQHGLGGDGVRPLALGALIDDIVTRWAPADD